MFYQNPELVYQLIESKTSFRNWFGPDELKYTRSSLKEVLSSLQQHSTANEVDNDLYPKEPSTIEDSENDDCVLIDGF